MQYITRFEPKKKLGTGIFRMATVWVYTLDDKEVGHYSFGYLPTIAKLREETIDNMVYELVREYETRKIWNLI